MGDGKCPDIYECRLGSDKVMKQLANAKLTRENSILRKQNKKLVESNEKLHTENATLRLMMERIMRAPDASGLVLSKLAEEVLLELKGIK